MQILDILRHKGSSVTTIAPTASVTELLATLAEHNIGALVVTRDDEVAGIVSERDVVRHLHDPGRQVLDGDVSAIMTSGVISCSARDSVDSVAEQMTQSRIRHMPVIEQNRLVGIVTIGDVVLSRIRQLEADRGQLEHYITG
jgi:CBS domain-containing protein